jgi:hypothetical protein
MNCDTYLHKIFTDLTIHPLLNSNACLSPAQFTPDAALRSDSIVGGLDTVAVFFSEGLYFTGPQNKAPKYMICSDVFLI